MFKLEKDDTSERLFARFNLIAKPLEDERPRVMTVDQLKTSYVHHVKQILSISQCTELCRDIREAERERDNNDDIPLTRYDIHKMVLRQDQEDVIEQSKLRAVGLQKIPMKERLGDRSRREESPPRANTKTKEPERRACHICKVKEHLAYNCPDKGATLDAPKVDMGGGDHPPKKDPNNSESP